MVEHNWNVAPDRTSEVMIYRAGFVERGRVTGVVCAGGQCSELTLGAQELRDMDSTGPLPTSSSVNAFVDADTQHAVLPEASVEQMFVEMLDGGIPCVVCCMCHAMSGAHVRLLLLQVTASVRSDSLPPIRFASLCPLHLSCPV